MIEIIILHLAVKMLQSEGQIPEKTVTEKSTELVQSFGKYESISDITDTEPTSDSLNTQSGKS